MNSVILSIILFIVGATSYASISYIAKYLKSPETKFNMLYLLTSLLSMFLVILLSPTFLIPGILPFAVSGATGTGYIIAAAFSMGFSANFLVNLPLSFLLKKLASAKIVSLTDIKPNVKYVLYLATTILMIAMIFGASVYAIIQYEASIHTTGTIKTVGVKVYSDSGLTNELTEIDWGLQEPGSEVSISVYIQNTGTEPATLTFYTSNWNPAAANDYMSITWDYDSTVIAPNSARHIILKLTVSAEISGITNFSFDITIVATEA